jgi:hypothetical protein
MQITPAECDRFYRVWFSLLLHANRKYGLIEGLKAPADPLRLSISVEDASALRDKVWAEDDALDSFVADNPHALPPGDLALSSSWRHRVSGHFFIFRHLKRYTVFLDDSSPARAYGVLGLRSPMEEVVGPYLPIMVEAILLPFEDKIVYDGLLAPYPVLFGGGIRASLNDAYRDAKEREGIITQLGVEFSPQIVAERNAAANARLLKAFEKHMLQTGLSPTTAQQHAEVLSIFSREFLSEAYPEQSLREIELDQLRQFLRDWLPQHAPARQKKAHTSLKRFVWFLRDTGRIDWGKAQAALDVL